MGSLRLLVCTVSLKFEHCLVLSSMCESEYMSVSLGECESVHCCVLMNSCAVCCNVYMFTEYVDGSCMCS